MITVALNMDLFIYLLYIINDIMLSLCNKLCGHLRVTICDAFFRKYISSLIS